MRTKTFLKRWTLPSLVVIILTVAISGCYAFRDYLVLRPVNKNVDSATVDIQREELQAHVAFLAQPALKGRKPFSMGSSAARDCIVKRFEAFGLQPWGNAEGLEQDIVIGTNIIGVLPGSDPALANEFVFVSAHYDHVGGKRLGACDNAAGVAALLEIAERFALSDPAPKRPICFAAFDCEEQGLFGSTAFICRDDFDPGQVAALLNMDMLGSRFALIEEDALFAVGSQNYANVQNARKYSIRIR